MIVFTFIENVVPFVLAIATLIFGWGFLMYMYNSGDADKRKEGIDIMVMGSFILFVTVFFWGIIRFIASALLG